MAHGEHFCVLFDVGYGLCDEAPRLAVALRTLSSALAARNIHKSPHELNQLYRHACITPVAGTRSLLELALIGAGLTPELAHEVRREVVWDAEPLTLLPGALDTLRQLRAAGFRLGVLANQPASAAADLQRLGVTDLVDGVWISEAVGLHKPDPKFFQLALDALGAKPHITAYVGDRPDNDVAPARRMGLHTVRLQLGPHAEQEPKHEDERPHHTALSLPGATSYLLRWIHGHV